MLPTLLSEVYLNFQLDLAIHLVRKFLAGRYLTCHYDLIVLSVNASEGLVYHTQLK